MICLQPNWDNYQKKLGASILQSSVWAKFQESLGNKVYCEASSHWSWLGIEKRAAGFRYLFLPYGPTIKSEAKNCLESIISCARENSVDFVRLEPLGKLTLEDLSVLGTREVNEIEPKHTLIIDLTKSLNDLRQDLKSGHRNLINGTKRRDLEITQSNSKADFEHFLSMLKDTSSRSGVTFHPASYFRRLFEVLGEDQTAKLYIARRDKEPIAAALFYDYHGIRYYAHAGAYQELNRKYNASVSLLWQAIVDAKDLGMQYFDMWGIAPNDDPKHKWAGITKFKKGYGGREVSYLGTYEIPIKRTKYRAFEMLKKLRGGTR